MTIHAAHLSHRYGSALALDDLTLEVSAGELCCLLGPNGAGKSTTINCLLGFLTPSSGHATINGVRVDQDPVRARAQLAYIPENVMLYPYFSGRENLAFFSELAGHRYTMSELDAFLVQTGLASADITRRVSGYSKGMRQKVGIAIALAKRATALLLDEPTSGLDPKASNEFSRLLLDLRAQGTAILMATHDIFRAREVATSIGIMQRGRLVHHIPATAVSPQQLEALYLDTVAA
jgi:ABC-2 type transport system ATP-binding protein